MKLPLYISLQHKPKVTVTRNWLYYKITVLIFFALFAGLPAWAQDPHLPPTNLGITNMQDGNAPGPGWYYMQFVQAYQSNNFKNGTGQTVADAPQINSILAMQQLIFISKAKFLGGNLGYTTIVPLVKLSATGNNGVMPTINPNPLGDIITGPLIQWSNKKLWGMDYSHRLELDLGIPTGAYQQGYDINPGAHIWRIFPHYTFTLSPTKNLSFSMRHHLTYYFDEIGTRAKPGITYNFNYSAEYTIAPGLTLEIAGYYLNQLQQDSYNGNNHYYQDTYHISNTKERVFAYGPGIGYVTPTGLFIELKGMQETSAINRSQGFRTTLAVAYKLDK